MDCDDGMCTETFQIFSDFGICYTKNMMTASMIFNTEEIHEDFLKIITRFGNESEPLWTTEKGYKDEAVNFPERAFRGFRGFTQNFLPMLNEIDKENICELKAFKIFMHSPNEILTPFHDFFYLKYDEYMEFKLVPHGHRTDEALKNFSPELRKCYFEGERKLQFFKTYSKALCKWECKSNLTLEKCGCVKFSMPRNRTTKVCNLREVLCTLNDFEMKSCRCYKPCTEVTYTYKIEKMDFNRGLFSELPNT